MEAFLPFLRAIRRKKSGHSRCEVALVRRISSDDDSTGVLLLFCGCAAFPGRVSTGHARSRLRLASLILSTIRANRFLAASSATSCLPRPCRAPCASPALLGVDPDLALLRLPDLQFLHFQPHRLLRRCFLRVRPRYWEVCLLGHVTLASRTFSWGVPEESIVRFLGKVVQAEHRRVRQTVRILVAPYVPSECLSLCLLLCIPCYTFCGVCYAPRGTAFEGMAPMELVSV